MRHRASRPLTDLWRRVLRASAVPIGALGRRRAIRALAALMVMLGLGTGVFVAVAATDDASSRRTVEPQALGERPSQTTSRAGERPALPDTTSVTHGASSAGRAPRSGSPEPPSSEPPTTTPTRSLAPEAVPSVVPSAPGTPSEIARATGSSSTTAATPSHTPSQQVSHAPSATPRDTTPPDTRLSEEYPEGDAAVFSFSSNETASFTCSLDGAAYTACGSPASYSGLDSGWHTFSVRATDAAGNVDPSPASTRWHSSSAPSDDD